MSMGNNLDVCHIEIRKQGFCSHHCYFSNVLKPFCIYLQLQQWRGRWLRATAPVWSVIFWIRIRILAYCTLYYWIKINKNSYKMLCLFVILVVIYSSCSGCFTTTGGGLISASSFSSEDVPKTFNISTDLVH